MSTLFHSLPDFPYLLHGDSELRRNDDYLFDNSKRDLYGGLVIQRTESGSAWIKDDQGLHTVPPGHAMLFGHGEQSVYGIGKEKPYRLKFLILAHQGGMEELFNRIRSDFGVVISMRTGGESERLMTRLLTAYNEARDQLWMAEQCYRLLIAVYREQMADRQGQDPVEYGRYLLESQYRSPRNLKEWAEVIGISREHFSREFHLRYGESPKMFLRRLRLEYGKMLLQTSEFPVEEVALLSGFTHVQTFRRAFRQNFGETVGETRAHLSV